MGPRPFGRGRPKVRFVYTARVISFNGAATFRSRKEDVNSTARPDLAPLQWGRDLSVAEGLVDGVAAANKGLLQWGRDLSVAEGARVPAAARALDLRLQWGRDLSVAEGPPLGPRPRPRRRFNGAATFRSRKGGAGSAAAHEDERASMGPRPFGRGRIGDYCHVHLWDPSFNGAATFRSRKGEGTHQRNEADKLASMGPRPFGRGRDVEDKHVAATVSLQWGRDLSVAEGSSYTARARSASGLQRGRDLSVAEG